MKKILLIALTLIFVFSLSANVFAGDFTMSDSNKNSFYQRVHAVNYAATYVNNPNPYYPNFSLNCTNYVSQCLYAGGMPKISNVYEVHRQWYMNRNVVNGHVSYLGTQTWTVAHDARYHWANVNGYGWQRAYQYKVYRYAKQLKENDSLWNDLYYRCSGGDIIQYVYGPSSSKYGKTYHSQVVHRRSLPNTQKKISMAQNTPNGWRDLYSDSLKKNDRIICLIRIKNVQRPIDTVNP